MIRLRALWHRLVYAHPGYWLWSTRTGTFICGYCSGGTVCTLCLGRVERWQHQGRCRACAADPRTPADIRHLYAIHGFEQEAQR